MSDGPELTEQFMVRVSPTMLADLKRRAADEERTVAGLVRFAIRRYLGASERGES